VGRAISALAATERHRLAARARTGDGAQPPSAAPRFIIGARADFFTTLVRTGGPGGPTLLVVERDTPGFSVGRRLEKVGWWCSDTVELSFQDARVPVANRLGDEGTGFGRLMANFQTHRLFLAVQAYATAQRCLELSLRWARTREVFGSPLAEKQVIRHKLAEMARLTDVAMTGGGRAAVAAGGGRHVARRTRPSRLAASWCTRRQIQGTGLHARARERHTATRILSMRRRPEIRTRSSPRAGL
jgi:acyl-CoA dehydrogenase